MPGLTPPTGTGPVCRNSGAGGAKTGPDGPVPSNRIFGKRIVNQFLIDNILLIAIILVCVVTLLAPYIAKRRYGPEVDSASATELINHKGAQIVDLRDPKDFKKECIARSVNIPADRIHHEFEKIDKTKPVLLVDEDCKRARMASPLLRGLGFKEVYILQGGLNGWRRASMPFKR